MESSLAKTAAFDACRSRGKWGSADGAGSYKKSCGSASLQEPAPSSGRLPFIPQCVHLFRKNRAPVRYLRTGRRIVCNGASRRPNRALHKTV